MRDEFLAFSPGVGTVATPQDNPTRKRAALASRQPVGRHLFLKPQSAHMDEDLRPGVDRPRRVQYVIAILVIVILSAIAYFCKRAALA